MCLLRPQSAHQRLERVREPVCTIHGHHPGYLVVGPAGQHGTGDGPHPLCLHIDPTTRPVLHGEVHVARVVGALTRESGHTPAAAMPPGPTRARTQRRAGGAPEAALTPGGRTRGGREQSADTEYRPAKEKHKSCAHTKVAPAGKNIPHAINNKTKSKMSSVIT